MKLRYPKIQYCTFTAVPSATSHGVAVFASGFIQIMRSTAERPRRLHPAAQIAAGSLSACLSVLFTNIPEVVKTRLQLDGEGIKAGGARQYSSFADALGKIWRQEGLRGVQAGLSSALLHQTTMNGARLGLFEPIQRALSEYMPGPISRNVAAGALSGGIGAICGSPFYLVKSRLQAQSPFFVSVEKHGYSGTWDGLRQIYRTEGTRGLFRGIDGALPRVMTGSAIQLTSYDLCKAWISKHGIARDGGIYQHTLAGLVSSLVTVTAINPLGTCNALVLVEMTLRTRAGLP
jgi:solute carrier family 25, member 34/35